MTDTTEVVAIETTEEKKVAKTRTSITISPEILEAVRKRAELENTSVSNIIEVALKSVLGVV